MPASIKDFYNQVEQIKGKKLYTLLIIIFVIFLLVGLFIGYFNNQLLNKNENHELKSENEVEIKNEFYGKVHYVDPNFYPNDNVSYVLLDSNGKDIILLSSKDDKLEIVEGLYVKVLGRKGRLSDGKTEYLSVTEVIINQ